MLFSCCGYYGNELDRRNIAISALNCSGSPLVNNAMSKAHSQTIHDTAELAGELEKLAVCPKELDNNGVEKIAIEKFPCQLVYNVRILNKLVEIVNGELDN